MARKDIGDVFREAGGALGAVGTQRRLSRQEEEQRMKEEKAARLADMMFLPTPGGGTALVSREQIFQGLGKPDQQPQIQQLIKGKETTDPSGFNLKEKIDLEKVKGALRTEREKTEAQERLERDFLKNIRSIEKSMTLDPFKGGIPPGIGKLLLLKEYIRAKKKPPPELLEEFPIPPDEPVEGEGDPIQMGGFRELQEALGLSGLMGKREVIPPPETQEVTPTPTGVEVDNTQEVINRLMKKKTKEERLAAYERAKPGFAKLVVDDAAVRKALGLK